jgi:hypothetical protein
MFTLELAERLQGTAATANALHSATLMDTKIVLESGCLVLASSGTTFRLW